ncbi:DNA adenine methylase [Helicobacter trogontum]|uniref:DNA adenine methylase n=1 Tax=Helicobacter trogontum TaxID=50960 RepID=A0ABQ0D5Y1_9HELI
MNKSGFYKPTTLKAPFAWVGGKSKLAKDIVALMPPHKCYVEVFGGALSVLYAKPSVEDILAQRAKKRISLKNTEEDIQKEVSIFIERTCKGETRVDKLTEIVNDINDDLINLHRIIKTRPKSLHTTLSSMLVSRTLFDGIKKGIIKPKNDIERAAFYYFLITQSFGGKRKSFILGKTRPPKNIHKDFMKFSQRLKRVYIEHMDFRKLIATYDSKDTLFYLDPPYFATEHYYEIKGGFGESEHRDLAVILQGIQGNFILSYNDCEFIRSLYKDFYIMETKKIQYSLNVKSTKRVQELLIMNFKP